MSASAPPGKASRNVGRIVATCTRATINGIGAKLVIIQPAPVFWSHRPSEVTTLAPQSRR